MEKMTEKKKKLHEVFRLYYIYIAELIKEHLLLLALEIHTLKKLLHYAQFLAQTSCRIKKCEVHFKE